MVCLRILVLNAKIRISRIQKQTCLRFCSGGVSSAQPKIGDKRRTPAFRKLSFHQFFGSLPFFAPACVRRCRTFSCSLRQVPGTSRADRRPPRRDFPQSAPFLSECRAAQGAHSSQTTAAGRFPSPRQVRGHPVRISLRRGGISRSRRRSFRNAALRRAHIRPKRPLPDVFPLPGRSGDIACGKASAASRELSPDSGVSYGGTGPAADSRALRNGSERAIPPARGTPCCGG